MYRPLEINKNGLSINGRLYSAKDSADITRAVIYIHGFGGSRENYSAQMIADNITASHNDVVMVTFDLPCHGDDNSPELTLTGCDSYIDTVIGRIGEEYGPREWYICGSSFGGYLSLRRIAMGKERFRKAALRCPAVNMHELMTQTIFTADDIARLERGEYVLSDNTCGIKVYPAFVEELRQNDIRGFDFSPFAEDILIIQGTEDELVPYEEIRRFAANNGIVFEAAEGVDHRFSVGDSLERAVGRILEFLEI